VRKEKEEERGQWRSSRADDEGWAASARKGNTSLHVLRCRFVGKGDAGEAAGPK
jgi:hypothetical protein